MLTVVETTLFSVLWPRYWTPEQFGEFCAWLALNPEGGDVVPGSGGCRKTRWKADGRGKRGGVRVIHYNRLANGQVWLLTMYSKSERVSISRQVLKAVLEKAHGEGKSEVKERSKARAAKYR